MDRGLGTDPGDLPSQAQHFGSLSIDRGAREVTMDDQIFLLSRTEYELLSILAANPGKAISSRSLLGAILNTEWTLDPAPLHIHISRLRRKLGESGRSPRHIIAVYGYGYRFQPHPNPVPNQRAPQSPRDRSPKISSDGSPHASTEARHPVQALIASDHTLLWLSDNVLTLLGSPAHALAGRNVCSIVHPADLETSFKAAGEAGSGLPVHFTWRPRTERPEPIRIQACVRPLIDSSDSVRAYLAEWRPHSGDAHESIPCADLRPIRLDP